MESARLQVMVVSMIQNQEARSNTLSEDRKRKTVSRLINCLFAVRGKKIVDGYWILEIVNESNNLDPSVDMSGHPSCRRFSEDEILPIREMIKSGVATRQILASLRQSNPKLEAIANLVHNMKAKIHREYLGGRTMIQALLEELGKGGFIHNYSHDSNGYLTCLFFAHPYSIVLTKSYSNVFVMDCTYKTNKYKMSLLEIVGITSFNTSFCSYFTFLQKEEVDDYIWALRMFSDIMGDNLCPFAIVRDRELALMNAIKVVFPATQNILCIWHTEKNLVTHGKKHFIEGEDWGEFLSSWTEVKNSSSELEYEASWQQFEQQYQQKALLMDYIKSTWLPFKEHFISAWTDKHMHLGSRVSLRAEGTHAIIKKYLQDSSGDLCELKNRMCQAIEHHYKAIKTQISSENTCVSVFSLNKIFKQNELPISRDALLTCKSRFTSTMGLPCAHKMRTMENRALRLDDIHPQWRLDIRSFVDDDEFHHNTHDEFKLLLDELQHEYEQWPIDKKKVVQSQVSQIMNESTPILPDPLIQSHKGRLSFSRSKKGELFY